MKPLALLSVTDKTGIVEFARGLLDAGFELISTGGTGRLLDEQGFEVTSVSYYTGMPEILDGRVKTLHPRIHGGLLARPEDVKHQEEMDELNIRPIRVLAVNLYPFEQTVLRGSPPDEVIENIDIGGPAMIRAAAKNAGSVFVVTDPEDYPRVLEAIRSGDDSIRESLRAKAFRHTAFYDALIAEYLSDEPTDAPPTLTVPYRLRQSLRYGENPHQSAALYVRPFEQGGVASANQLWGKELSYNNILDAEAAWELASDLFYSFASLVRPVAIIKHGNPCGAAWTGDPRESFRLAKEADPVSAFGGIVAVPGELEKSTAEVIAEKGNFFEVVICSAASDEAVAVFRERSGWGQDVRILAAGAPPRGSFTSIRGLRGAALVQSSDVEPKTSEWKVVTRSRPERALEPAMRGAWTVVKHVKSNAIVVCSPKSLLGVGAGQSNRVQSVRLALGQAGESARGAVLASDAFFPFADSILEAASAGVAAVVQPGGSKRDAEVIAAADEAGLAMVFTSARHFRH